MTILWFAWRDLLCRRGRAYGAVLVVASAVAFSVTVELVSRAREAAIATQLDAVGPALRILPAGATPHSIAQETDAPQVLPPGTVEAVRRTVGAALTTLEQRRVAWAPVAGRRSLVMWVGTSPDGVPALRVDEVALGAVLASSLGVEAGQTVEIRGDPFRIARVLPSRADADDTAAFLSLAALPVRSGAQAQPTELRLHVRPGTDVSRVASDIEAAVAGISILRPDRGAVVESEAQNALATHRHLVWWITGLVSLVCLAIASHLDAQERRREAAMLVAIGAAGYDVALAGVTRSAALGAAGGFLGFVLGTVATLVLDAEAASSVLPAFPLAAAAISAATLVGIAVALPTGTAAALRDPVAELQDV